MFSKPDHAGGAAFRHSLMNALRSSPFLSAAFTLHAFIFSCCVILAGATSLPERHALMKDEAAPVSMRPRQTRSGGQEVTRPCSEIVIREL